MFGDGVGTDPKPKPARDRSETGDQTGPVSRADPMDRTNIDMGVSILFNYAGLDREGTGAE